MNVPDVNVLLYAYDESSAHHDVAKEWLEESLSSTEPTGLPWAILIAFLRLSTHAAVFTRPMSPAEALDVLDGWLAQPYAAVIGPGSGHAAILRELIEAAGVAGDLTSDAHLAALAIEHEAALASFDGDFHRFRGLRFEHLR